MLVLSRKKNEAIIVGDNVKIVVVEIRGDKVRLGVEAPKEVTVHRQEVYDAIHRQNVVADQALTILRCPNCEVSGKVIQQHTRNTTVCICEPCGHHWTLST